MKCNKCLKIIPKGEEIRFYAKNGNTHWQDYGGYYCEDCWKKSGLYEYYEDGGKKTTSDGSITSWGLVAMGFVLGMIASILVWIIIEWVKYDRKK